MIGLQDNNSCINVKLELLNGFSELIKHVPTKDIHGRRAIRRENDNSFTLLFGEEVELNLLSDR